MPVGNSICGLFVSSSAISSNWISWYCVIKLVINSSASVSIWDDFDSVSSSTVIRVWNIRFQKHDFTKMIWKTLFKKHDLGNMISERWLQKPWLQKHDFRKMISERWFQRDDLKNITSKTSLQKDYFRNMISKTWFQKHGLKNMTSKLYKNEVYFPTLTGIITSSCFGNVGIGIFGGWSLLKIWTVSAIHAREFNGIWLTPAWMLRITAAWIITPITALSRISKTASPWPMLGVELKICFPKISIFCQNFVFCQNFYLKKIDFLLKNFGKKS